MVKRLQLGGGGGGWGYVSVKILKYNPQWNFRDVSQERTPERNYIVGFLLGKVEEEENSGKR